MSNSQLIVAQAVHELLADEDLDTLAHQAATGYRCVACGEPATLADGPAAVIVRLLGGDNGGVAPAPVAHVRLAHQRCSPSRVTHDSGVLTVPAELTMQATAVVLPEGMRRRALLIVEPTSAVRSITDGGERLDTLTAGLLDQGLSLLSTPWQRAPTASGWLVRLPSPIEAIVCDPEGEQIYAGELDQPKLWRKIITRGQVELLVGAVGLAALQDDPAAGLAALEEVAQQGRLVGATVALQRGSQGTVQGD